MANVGPVSGESLREFVDAKRNEALKAVKEELSERDFGLEDGVMK
jgi:hypothetical protein